MKEKASLSKKERLAGERVLLIGVGALIMLAAIVVLEHQGYITIFLPH